MRVLLLLIPFLLLSCSSTPQKPLERKVIVHSALTHIERAPAGGFSSLINSCKTFASKFMAKPSRFDALAESAHSRLNDPFGKVYSLTQFAPYADDPELLKRALEDLFSALKEESMEVRKSRLTDWVQSDHHALFLYQTLYEDGLYKNEEVVDHLFAHSEFFKDIKRIRGPPHSAVTYSFEKESSISDIALWYKDASFTDEQWFNLTEKEQLDKLNALTEKFGMKKFLSADKVAPTEFRPKYLSGYSRELENPRHEGYSWEIANKLYEVKLDRLLKEVEEVAEFTKEGHSFHTHIVFEMKDDYAHFNEFSYWSKQVNDYLFLKGMEESLHGSDLVGIATLTQSRHSFSPTKLPRKKQVSFALPFTSPTELGKQNYKFFSMGLRGTIYGKSTTPGFTKVGLELRDTSRHVDILSDHMKRISDSVADFAWEKLPVKQIEAEDDVTFILTSKSRSVELMSEYMDREVAEEMFEYDMESAIPFLKFESGKFLDYKNGTFKQASSEQIERIQQAREKFIQDIHSISKEINGYKQSGEEFAEEDVSMAIRMSLSEWAKKAKASELFSGI